MVINKALEKNSLTIGYFGGISRGVKKTYEKIEKLNILKYYLDSVF